MSSQEFRRGRGNNLRGARGSRRARGGWQGSSHASASTPQQLPRANEAFGPRIDSFKAKHLLIEEESPEIEDVKYVGSYNWLNDSSPTILVPGQFLLFSFLLYASSSVCLFTVMPHADCNTARLAPSLDSVG